ncbi:olfactory receptor 2at4-like [Lynx pardinus]|uniref:Olfactory receptor 2at4-like n=1 Tax=Lynx pardinus TaxID=191816 RepID=A0A485MFM1_LYNPA|nr:olfactory receptor 2at4-like [Lynx pardinus]
MAVSFLPLVLVLLSYAHILASVLHISSREGRSEASTYSSHLLVVGTYYLSIAIAYVAYSANLPLDFHIMGNVVYAILTPVLNPLIYAEEQECQSSHHQNGMSPGPKECWGTLILLTNVNNNRGKSRQFR